MLRPAASSSPATRTGLSRPRHHGYVYHPTRPPPIPALPASYPRPARFISTPCPPHVPTRVRAIQLSRTPAVSQARVRPAPQVGEHSAAVLAEYGFSADEIAALTAPPSSGGSGKAKGKGKSKL